MPTPTLEIWSVDGGNNDTKKTDTTPLRRFTCSVDQNHILQIGITGFSCGNLTCILIGLGNTIQIFPPRSNVTKPTTPVWNVDFEGIVIGTYLVACHSPNHGNDYAEVTIVMPDSSSVSSSRKHQLAFDSGYPTFGNNQVIAKGTVLNPGNTVSCTITPIDCESGVQRGKVGLNDADFTDLDQTHWHVEFDSLSGCYQLKCENSEGEIYGQGTAG